MRVYEVFRLWTTKHIKSVDSIEFEYKRNSSIVLKILGLTVALCTNVISFSKTIELEAQFEFLINQYFPEAEFYAKEIFTIRLWFWNMNIEVILLHVLYIVHFYLETVSLDQLSHCDSLLLSVFVPVYRALTVFRPAIRYKKITSFFF